jgi:hypothetical protein
MYLFVPYDFNLDPKLIDVQSDLGATSDFLVL